MSYAGCFSPDGTIVERTVGPADVASDLYGGRQAMNPAARVARFIINVVGNIKGCRSIATVTDGLANTVIVSEVVSGDYRGLFSHTHGVAYTHQPTPNSSTPDRSWSGCVSRPNAPCVDAAQAWGLKEIAARSNHTGGVSALLGDGSVRFVRNEVDQKLWQAAASINAGEGSADV